MRVNRGKACGVVCVWTALDTHGFTPTACQPCIHLHRPLDEDGLKCMEQYAALARQSTCTCIAQVIHAGPGRFGGQISVTDIYHTMPYHAALHVSKETHRYEYVCCQVCTHWQSLNPHYWLLLNLQAWGRTRHVFSATKPWPIARLLALEKCVSRILPSTTFCWYSKLLTATTSFVLIARLDIYLPRIIYTSAEESGRSILTTCI